MSITTIGTFIEIFDMDNNVKKVKHRLQNAKLSLGDPKYKNAANTIVFKSEKFHYMPFIYLGTTINKSGANIESQLIMGNAPMSMSRAQEAVTKKYFIEVNVCILDNQNLDSIKKILTSDTWLISNLSYDPERLELTLSSAIDSVGSNIPNLVLTADCVGALPTTSDIQNR